MCVSYRPTKTHKRNTTTTRTSAGGIAVAYNDDHIYWQGPVVVEATRTLRDYSTDSHSISIKFDNVGQAGLSGQTNTSAFEVCVLGSGANCTQTSAANATGGDGDWITAEVESVETDTVHLLVTYVEAL